MGLFEYKVSFLTANLEISVTAFNHVALQVKIFEEHSRKEMYDGEGINQKWALYRLSPITKSVYLCVHVSF